MLQTIKDGILSIVSFFDSVIGFVVGLIEDTTNFISKIPESVEQVTSYMTAFLPPEVMVLLVGILAIVVILRVLGRD